MEFITLRHAQCISIDENNSVRHELSESDKLS
jgi:hypothetical protein